MCNLNYHLKCHFNNLIDFIYDLKAEFGDDKIDDILSYHDELLDDILNFNS